MVNKFDDMEILNYLMTSEFSDDLSSEESKFLLIKFRNFYRLQSAKIDQLKYQISDIEFKSESEILKAETKVNEVNLINQTMLNKINYIKNKKLSLNERIKGKINLNDEIK